MFLVDVPKSDLISTWINPDFLDPDHLYHLQQKFLRAGPFPHLLITDLIKKEKLTELVENLMEIQFTPKYSDLFRFHSTIDFSLLDNVSLKTFHKLFRSTEFLSILRYLTQTQLIPAIDMFGSLYQDTDYLLCHEDQLPQRRIAFIFYLTTLKESDGGALVLFNSKKQRPVKKVKKILPKTNSLMIFLVTPISFHEVEEIVNPDANRISITGWYRDQ